MKARCQGAEGRHFGSGWVFLVTDPRWRGLDIVTTPNQDSALLPPGVRPAPLANDLGEHAHYLDRRDPRAEYLREWWRVVDWSAVGERPDAIRAGETGRLAGPAR